MDCLIIGKGDIGTSLGNVLAKVHHVEYLDPPKSIFCSENYEPKVIHVCIRYIDQDHYLKTIGNYLRNFERNLLWVIIDGTIPFGIAPQLQRMFPNQIVAYSPCRGTHPSLEKDFLIDPKFIGLADPLSVNLLDAVNFLRVYYEPTGIKILLQQSSEECVLGKILNTSWFAMQIAFANQIYLICLERGLNFEQAYTQWMETDRVGKKYVWNEEEQRAITKEKISRPVMVPGEINGHCLMPNLELFKEYAPKFYDWIHKVNDKIKKDGVNRDV